MKKKLKIIGLIGMNFFILCFSSLNAQPVNLQLRQLFKNLTPPTNPPADALYDMSTHMTGNNYWTSVSYTNTNTSNWVTMYDEFYYMLYDTTDLNKADSVITDAYRFKGDTILLGILDRNYFQFVDSALNSTDTIYFQQDSITLELIDYPPRVASPYLHKNVFTFSALNEKTPKNHVTYRIDPDYIFNDLYNIYNAEKILEMNFDDGTGWHTISPSVVTHINAVYTSGSSDRILEARVLKASDGTELRHSQSSLKVTVAPQQTQADTMLNSFGLNIGIFRPCISQLEHERKYIIFLEGIDMMEENDVSDIYSSSISGTRLAELQNHGYTYVVVDWQNSARDMRDNANSVISLINYLKCQLISGGTDIDTLPPFVVIGESMGGVIGRYALTRMENMPGTSCKPNLMHNTRLFISIDAPQQGANVPMAFQEMYRDISGPFFHMPINIQVRGTRIRNYLNLMAPKQLLMNHVATNNPMFNSYYPHPERLLFMSDLIGLDGADGYPDFVRKFAISDGLMTGEHLLDITEASIMNPGDDFLDANASVEFRLFGRTLLGVNGGVNVKAMPPIGNAFYDRNIAVNHWGVSINWRTINVGPCPFCVKIRIPAGISVGLVNTTVSSHTAINGNLPTLDHMPGGFISLEGDVNVDDIGAQLDFINWTVDPVRIPSTPLNVPGFQIVGLSANLNATTQSLNFNFIPIQSALDYSGAANTLDHDIFNENTAVKLSRTPFDVIMGEYNGLGSYPNSGPMNRYHTGVRNEAVGSLLSNNRNEYMLNREIGEDELNLDNWTVHPAMIPFIEAENIIRGGSRENNYYDYPSQPSSVHFPYSNPNSTSSPYTSLPNSNGVFSKERPIRIMNFAAFKSLGAFIDNGIIGPYQWINQPQFVCSQSYRKRSIKDNENLAELEGALGVNFYPNPTHNSFILEVKQQLNYEVLQIFNLNGKLIKEQQIQTNKEIIDISTFTDGIYMMKYGTTIKKLVVTE